MWKNINSFQYLRVMGPKSISDHGWELNIFCHGRTINVFGLVLLGGNLNFWQFGQLGIWVTWTLSNLDFGQFANSKYWETYVLKNLTRALMAESISGLFFIGFTDLGVCDLGCSRLDRAGFFCMAFLLTPQACRKRWGRWGTCSPSFWQIS